MTTPVTIIGGYLGAGKTTLINHLLARLGSSGGTSDRTAPVAASYAAPSPIGVLVNDFGAINIDADLIAEHDGTTMTLTNGCVCCSITDDLGTALEALRHTHVEHVVVEASGAAVPVRVADFAETWPGYHLAGTRVLMDGSDWRRQLKDKFIGTLVREQLIGADIRFVTKLDLCSTPDSDLQEIQRMFGPSQKVICGDMDPQLILATLPRRTPRQTTARTESASDWLRNSLFQSDRALPHAATERVLLHAATKQAATNLERVKGWIATERGRFLVQLAAGRLSLSSTPAGESASSQLVIIGADAAVRGLQQQLDDLDGLKGGHPGADSRSIQPPVRPAR